MLAEESAVSKRKSGVTEVGKRMLDQTLEEIVADIQEEVPPSQKNALFGLPESPTSPANAPAVESAGGGSAPTAPTIPSAGIPISAVTEQNVPKDHDSKLETCKACAGSGRADPGHERCHPGFSRCPESIYGFCESRSEGRRFAKGEGWRSTEEG